MQEFIVSTLEDENDGNFGEGDLSLREAIATANSGDTITFNSSLSGGTIDLSLGELLIDRGLAIEGLGAENLTISGNGSRVFRIDDGDSAIAQEVVINRLTIANGTDNDADEGGGGILNAENLTLQNSVVTSSSAGSSAGGGGIRNSGTANILNSTFIDNGAFRRGGAISSDGTLNLRNSTVDDNFSLGGAISSSGVTEISNSTITRNTGNVIASGTAIITSSIITDNSAVDFLGGNGGNRANIEGDFVSGGNNLIGIGNDNFVNGVSGDIVGTVSSPLNPQLGELQNNGGSTPTRELLLGSPALDAGSNPFGLDTDQRGDGFDRTIGNGTDIGAFEVQTIVDPNPDITPIVTTLNDENDGDLSVGDISLREAILFSDDGETITFDSNLGGGTITLALGQLAIDKSLTIQGLGADRITIDGAGNSRVFDINDRLEDNSIDVALDGLKITGGSTGIGISESGGGISNTENLILSNSVVSNNSVGLGAGGAGIANSGTLDIINSTIADNLAPLSFSARPGISGAGGIDNVGTLNVTNSTIANNVGGSGGGIDNRGTANVTNSTITNNTAINTDFVSFGGGINGTATVTSSIIAGNNGEDLSSTLDSTFNSGGNNLIGNVGDADGFTDGVNGDIVGTADNPIDPGLGELQDNGGATPTIALLENSPAIDAGSNLGGLATDQRGVGFDRTVGAGTDIGAFELQTVVTPSVDEILGTAGGDVLNGTESGDRILGLDGNDTIRGLSGDDTIEGNNGNDSIEGGADNDFLDGFEGFDSLFGGEGNDALNGGNGNDSLDGGAGNDLLIGDGDRDTLLGGDGEDTLEGGAGVDFLDGGANNDQLFGGGDNDSLRGGLGDDLLDGGAGIDSLEGGAGNDTLLGLEGDDSLFGGNGNDFIDGGSGNDSLRGDDGNDTFVLASGNGTDFIVDFNRGNNLLGLSSGISFADLSFSGNDIILGDETLATLNGVDANSLTESNFTNI